MKIRWPLMWVSTHEAVRLENYTLRDVLREANRELRKHKELLAGLQNGTIDIVAILDKVKAK